MKPWYDVSQARLSKQLDPSYCERLVEGPNPERRCTRRGFPGARLNRRLMIRSSRDCLSPPAAPPLTVESATMNSFLRLITAAAVLALTIGVGAQDAQKPDEKDKDTAPKELKGLKYRPIGPAAGGRVSRAAGVPGDPTTYYAATASGGVWKSTDGGVTWKSVFDDQPVSSIGSLAIAPSDPNIVYVGSGEANIRGNVAEGNGIYKTVDGGKTWTHVWKQRGQIGTMVVHPTNADIAFAAVLGQPFGANPERGVYRTKDGGKTWQQVLKKDADTGASDIAMDPDQSCDPLRWLLAGAPISVGHDQRRARQRSPRVARRRRHVEAADQGRPARGHLGQGRRRDRADPTARRVYALIEAEKGGLFKSDDGGESWERASANRAIRQRAWYYTTLTVNPANPEEVWFPQVPMLKTIDGGKTIQYVKGFHHGDHHDLWIDPEESEADDLVQRRRRRHHAERRRDLVRAAAADQPVLPPVGRQQRALSHRRLDAGPRHRAGAEPQSARRHRARRTGGASAAARPATSSPTGAIRTSSTPASISGIITRHDRRTGESRNVSAWPENPSGKGGEDMKYRFQWTAPIHVSPHDARVVYHGAQVIFRTADGGQSWDVISPDLTRNDKSRQKWSGGPITGDNTGVETWGTVFTIVESPKEKGLIWAGSDDGLVHVTRDGGKNWSNVTGGLRWRAARWARSASSKRRRSTPPPRTSSSTTTGSTT